MTPFAEPLGLHQLGPVSFLTGIGLFGTIMFLNALGDTAWALARSARRPADCLPPLDLLPPPYAGRSSRVLPAPPWERRPASRMPRVAPPPSPPSPPA